MTNQNTPVFSSPNLQKAVDAAHPLLSGADDAMTRVSNDIKNLEAWLKGLNLQHSFRYSLGRMPIADDTFKASIDEFGASACEFLEEVLSWEPDKSGTYRLLYEENAFQGYIDVDQPGGPNFCEETTLELRQRKPLIEMPYQVRKRMHQDHIADFIAAMSKHHKVDRVSSPDVEILF